MKDFYDIWLLSRQFQFNGLDLQKAISGTFSQRGTELPPEIEAFTEGFIKAKDVQWKTFRNNINSDAIPVSFEEVTNQIRSFIQPIIVSTVNEGDFNKSWLPESGWN
jgi:hypothetical protein